MVARWSTLPPFKRMSTTKRYSRLTLKPPAKSLILYHPHCFFTDEGITRYLGQTVTRRLSINHFIRLLSFGICPCITIRIRSSRSSPWLRKGRRWLIERTKYSSRSGTRITSSLHFIHPRRYRQGPCQWRIYY